MSPAIPPAVAEFAVQQLADREHPLIHPRARLLDALLSIADGVGADVGYVAISTHEDRHRIAVAVDDPGARAALAFDLGLARRSPWTATDGTSNESIVGTWDGAHVTVYGGVAS